MGLKVDKYRVVVDKRVKLCDDDKVLIKKLYDQGWAIRKIGREFEVSQRAVQFILFPEKLARNKELRRSRLLFDPHRYYNREKHRKAIADMRARKKLEHLEYYAKKCPVCGRDFIASRTNQIYCSCKCREKNQNKKQWQKRKKLL